MEESRERERAAALACLTAICGDENARDADRIAAAKLLLEGLEGGAGLTITMEGIPERYLV